MLFSAKHTVNNLLGLLGICLTLFAGYISLRLFYDPIKQEIRYAVKSREAKATLSPPNTDFAIIIDKIGASAAIIQDVDPWNSQKYQRALKDGVAHAQGTNLPGEGGNIFLFAHSSADLLTAERYNSIFYLIHHLQTGDSINIWYQNKEYAYVVTEKRFVSSKETQYLSRNEKTETLTLMTCWPPGTTLKRLIIIAKPSNL